MKEHPILFSTEMVKAILDGRKTMTRRVIKDPYKYITIPHPSPYGQVGDKLWVRETWTQFPDGESVVYKADGKPYFNVWKPSIFMPHKFSRITLEITNIRVERLQEINTKRHDEVAKEGWPFGYTGLSIEKAPVELFAELWDSINLKRGYSWGSNPWVWVIEFKKEINK